MNWFQNCKCIKLKTLNSIINRCIKCLVRSFDLYITYSSRSLLVFLYQDHMLSNIKWKWNKKCVLQHFLKCSDRNMAGAISSRFSSPRRNQSSFLKSKERQVVVYIFAISHIPSGTTSLFVRCWPCNLNWYIWKVVVNYSKHRHDIWFSSQTTFCSLGCVYFIKANMCRTDRTKTQIYICMHYTIKYLVLAQPKQFWNNILFDADRCSKQNQLPFHV